MDRQEEFKKRIKQLSARSYWLGVVLGLVVGAVAGFALGYALGSPTTLIVPLSEGVEV